MSLQAWPVDANKTWPQLNLVKIGKTLSISFFSGLFFLGIANTRGQGEAHGIGKEN